MITDWQFYLVAIPAVMLQGMGKGGFSGMGGLSLPLMCLAVPPVQAAAIQLPILMAQDIVGVWAYRRNLHRKNFLYCLPGTMIGIALGTFMAARVPVAVVQLLVGLIASGFVLLTVGRAAAGAKAAEPDLGRATLWASIGGFTSFVANAGGPPIQVYLMPQKLPPAVFAGTMAVLFAIVNYVKFAAFAAIGQISTPNLSTSAVLLPIAVAATFLGIWMVKHLSGAKFYPIVRGFTFLIGLKLIWDGTSALMRQG
jgi:uncharacterized protein